MAFSKRSVSLISFVFIGVILTGALLSGLSLTIYASNNSTFSTLQSSTLASQTSSFATSSSSLLSSSINSSNSASIKITNASRQTTTSGGSSNTSRTISSSASSLSSSATTASMTTSSSVSTTMLPPATRYVMLRFDDSFQDQWVNALPVLENYSFPATFLAITATIQNGSIPQNQVTGPFEIMNWQEFQWLYAHGYEICDHSSTHLDMNHLSSDGLKYQVVDSRLELANNGLTNIPGFALPYGDAFNNQTVISYILNSGFTRAYSAYGTPALSNYGQLHTIWYPIDNADSDTSFSLFQKLATQASSSVVIGFEFHHVQNNTCCTGYTISLASFKQDMAWLKANNFAVILPTSLPGYFSATTTSTPPISFSSSFSSIIPASTTTTDATSTYHTESTLSTILSTSTISSEESSCNCTTAENTTSSVMFSSSVTLSKHSSNTTEENRGTVSFSTSYSSYTAFSSSIVSLSTDTSSFSFIAISVTDAYQSAPATNSSQSTQDSTSFSGNTIASSLVMPLAAAVGFSALIFASQRSFSKKGGSGKANSQRRHPRREK